MKRFAIVGGVIALALSVRLAQGQQIHRNGFETGKTAWSKSGFDAQYDEVAHIISDQGAHEGQRSEYLQFNAKSGNFIYYHYPVAKAPVADDLVGSVYIKANRPGIQVLARIVLPNERDPNNLEYRMTTLIRGESYRNAGRWQRLDLGRPTQLAKQQQQLLQAQLKRAVNFTDAYVDAILLNLYAGPGPTEIWIDDVEIGPVLNDGTFKTVPGGDAGPVPTQPANIRRPGPRSQVVEFNANQLLVGGKRFFMRAVNHSNTPLRVLQQAGFNTVFVDYATDPGLLKEAADLGLWLAPRLRVLSEDTRLASNEGIQNEVGKYLDNDAVLMWQLSGGSLAFEQAVPVSRAASVVRGADPGRPLGAEVWDGMLPYSRSLNMLGVHRWPLMTTLELPKYREWLEMRRNLANPDAYIWTWIQNHVPDWHSQLLYERPGQAGYNEPVGPQPEQIQLLTYTAIAAGVRGVGFWSDRWLADSHHGRDRLLMCGLINQELELLEPLLSTATDPQWISTSSPDVKAAVLQTGKGILVLPMWHGAGAQFVPGQAAVAKLSMIVPQAPQSLQCWEVTPGEVRALRAERVPGGSKITLPEFGVTTAVVFTSDANLIVHFQEMAKSRRQLAAQWTYDMAVYELQKVLAVEKDLEQMGQTLPDGAALLSDAQKRLDQAKQLWDSRLFSEAYREAQRALRPVRILMRGHWDAVTKSLDSPVASPYAVSFYTLPRHLQLMAQVGRSAPASNVLPGGDFEIVPNRTQEAWKIEEPTLDPVELAALRVGQVKPPKKEKDKKDTQAGKGTKGVLTSLTKDDKDEDASSPHLPREGKQCALLQIKPKNPQAVPQALERTLLAITSPAVQLPPGTLVQVSGWITIPEKIKASADGALFYDSAGGEPLAIRLTEPMPWKRFTLYRRVPASGTLQVTLALTGIGSVYFDDVRIEPLMPAQ
jgi:hypothetical protein